MEKSLITKEKMQSIIREVFSANDEDISELKVIKAGMTNRSYRFKCFNNDYIIRIPGEGTEKLINRRNEYNVYQEIKKYNISDDIYYINPESGLKISRFYENSRTCDAYNEDDVIKCMKKLRSFHELSITVDHSFDIFGQIGFYRTLWQEDKSCYEDHDEVTKRVFELKDFIDMQEKVIALSHIDSVPDNFLFVKEGDSEEIKLIDWEYSGMQDVCVDIAMFAIYAGYDRAHIDRLIEIYYHEGFTKEKKLTIYCYVAACGLLWSNWCEYKRHLGVDFGNYADMQYNYAKQYCDIFKEEMRNR